jgi:hypothetical protein
MTASHDQHILYYCGTREMMVPLFTEKHHRSQEDTSMQSQPITHATLSPTALKTAINKPYPDSQGISSQVKDSSSAIIPIGIKSNNEDVQDGGKNVCHFFATRNSLRPCGLRAKKRTVSVERVDVAQKRLKHAILSIASSDGIGRLFDEI